MHKIKIALLYGARAFGLFAIGRYISRRSIMIVGWHGVSRDDEHTYFPSLYISKLELRRRLAFLTKNYSVVGLDSAVSQIESQKISNRQVVLTFDDGNFDFYAEAAPILREFEAPATNYVVTHYIETGEPVWNMLARYIIARGIRTGSATSTDIDEADVLEQLATIESHAEEVRLAERRELISRLAKSLKIELALIESRRLMHTMRPHEVVELFHSGFDFQMHTHEHKNSVDHFDELDRQIDKCRSKLEEWLHEPVQHFCYPSGRWTYASVDKLRAKNVRSATTTRPGPNLATTSVYSLRRVLNGEANSQIEFEFEMSNLRWLFKSLFAPATRHNPEPQVMSYADEKTHKWHPSARRSRTT